ncbi:MAG: 30S ribosomal protein S6 [Alphaproteobacteria bacterium]
MPYYETVFIARQDLTDAQVKDITEGFQKIITDQDGKIHRTEFWGLKSFAYRINKARKGHYVSLEMDVAPAALHEMERQMRLHEDVVRHLTIREEALSEGPSVMMDKGGRDDDKKKPYNKYNKDKEAA